MRAAVAGRLPMIACCIAALILAACATTVDPVPTPADAASPSTGSDGLPPVVESLPEFPGSLVATPGIPWEPPEWMSEAESTHDSAASLLLDFRRFLESDGSEVRVGLLGEPTDDAAQAYAQITFFGNESVAGTEFALELRRGDRGWFMTDAQFRSHCRRAVDLDTGSCV